MRGIDCRSLLRLQENFATRSKPRVQVTVAASCASCRCSISLLDTFVSLSMQFVEVIIRLQVQFGISFHK